jgi:hypothetical protein
MKPGEALKDFWNDNGDRVKTWFIVVIIVTAVYISVTFVMWGIFTPDRALIYGIAFILFYELFSRLFDKISEYKKQKKENELIFRTRLKEDEEERKEESDNEKKEKEPEKGKQ